MGTTSCASFGVPLALVLGQGKQLDAIGSIIYCAFLDIGYIVATYPTDRIELPLLACCRKMGARPQRCGKEVRRSSAWQLTRRLLPACPAASHWERDQWGLRHLSGSNQSSVAQCFGVRLSEAVGPLIVQSPLCQNPPVRLLQECCSR